MEVRSRYKGGSEGKPHLSITTGGGNEDGCIMKSVLEMDE